MKETGIVEEGRSNLLAAPGTQKKIDDAIQEVRTRYAREMKAVGLIARTKLWFRMQREIRAATEAIAPSRGCYAKQ